MAKTLYVVRHCQAEGQQPEAPLTPEGRSQAEALAEFLAGKKIERIVSSPFARARQSIEPLARHLNLRIETDLRLMERVLSTTDLPDWIDRLRRTFEDLDLSFAGGESSRAAMERAASAVDDALTYDAITTVIVSHGNLITLLLRRFDDRFGFDAWRDLTCPDVFRVRVNENGAAIERVWK